MNRHRGHIAIAGGGVAGCACAILLAEQGCDVTLFETIDPPLPVGAGLLLQPSGQRVLARLGLLDAVQAHGAPVERLFGDNAAGRRVLDLRYARFAPGMRGIGIQRGTLFGLLWRRLRTTSTMIRLGTTVGSFTQDGRRVALHDAQGRPLGRFDTLVIANGSFSTLRPALRVRQSTTPYPWGALWAVLPAPPGPASTELRQRYRAAREMVGLMPVGRALDAPASARPGITFYWSLPPSGIETWQQTPLGDWKARVVELLPDCAPVLEGLVEREQLRVARYTDVALQSWHDGRVVVVGDAGHGMSPQLGQGANMALIDACVFAHCAREALDWPSAFARYTRERRCHLRFYQRASAALTPLFQSHGRTAPLLRDLFFGLPGRLPWVHDQSVEALAGLKCGWLAGRLDLDRYLDPSPSAS